MSTQFSYFPTNLSMQLLFYLLSHGALNFTKKMIGTLKFIRLLNKRGVAVDIPCKLVAKD